MPPSAALTRGERAVGAGRSVAAVSAVAPLGVDVHVTVCARRCDYCAFATWTDRAHLMADYAAACRQEILEADLPPATSVFFGGGTPSLLPADLLVSILGAIRRFDVESTPTVATGVEITV